MDSRTLTLAPYLTLARDLTALIVPLQPSATFRENLETSLLAAARRQSTLEKLAIVGPAAAYPVDPAWNWRDLLPEGVDRRWVIGAAAVGSAVSVAGVMAFFWRQRGRRAA